MTNVRVNGLPSNSYKPQPIEPFVVPARVLRASTANDPAVGREGAGVSPPPPPLAPRARGNDDGPPQLPSGIDPLLLDLLVGMALGTLYLLCRENPAASAAASVALLTVVFWRM